MPPHTLSALRKLFPSDSVCVVRSRESGAVALSVGDADDATSEAAAAAMGTLMRSWGWDESKLIHITIEETGRTLVVNPTFEDGAWWVKGVGSLAE
jgi:hypothetical protein